MTIHFHDEEQIAKELVTAILHEGLNISVSDGVKHSTDRDQIMEDAGVTDETMFILYDFLGNRKGWFLLIHGNRCDVISNFTDNEICNEIWELVQPTVEYWEEYN